MPRHDARGDEVMSECENGVKRREVKTKGRIGERGTGGSQAEREVLRRQMSRGRGSKSSLQFSIEI